MISWLFMNQTGYNICQIKAEYLGYNMVSIISWWIKMLKHMCHLVTNILIFTNKSLNIDNLINIAHNLVKLSVLILDMLM